MSATQRRFPRRPPRLPVVFDAHQQNAVYFVTFCTRQRRPWLATAQTHDTFRAFIQRAWTQHHIAVGRYVIMPDHIHLLVAGGAGFELGKWVKSLKQSLGKTAETSANPELWQEGFFDHLIRRDEKLAAVWDYMLTNPTAARLTVAPADWPFQGEFIPLDRAR